MNLFFHIKLCLLSVLLWGCCGAIHARQDANPLLGMIGKEYGEYFDRYESLSDSLFYGDSLSRAGLVRLFEEAATADSSGEWELNKLFTECQVRFYESRDGGFIPLKGYTAGDMAQDLLAVAREAEKKGLLYVQLRALFKAADAYRIFLQEYEEAFALYLQVASRLDTLSEKEFPWKLYMYREIAEFYFSFHEYKDATVFFRKIVEDPDVTCKNNHRLYPALNGLAMCYRYAGQYERSDSCLLRILELSAPIEEDRYVWEGIAGGSIGCNYYLRGDLDKALSWMEPALTKMKRPNDDPYTSGLAANIANIYLKKNDLSKGEKYLNIALDYYHRTRIPDKNSSLLEVMACFHALKGNRQAAAAYLDSTLRAKSREQEAFSGLVLRRVEQQLRAADQRIHERKLEAEKLRSTFYRQTALWVTGALMLILALMLLLSFYYRRTRQAYHELVIRSQQWAGIEPAPAQSLPAEPVFDESISTEPISGAPISTESISTESISTEETSEEKPPVDACPELEELPADVTDRLVMEKLEKIVVHDYGYKRTDLTLDWLVAQTGMNRSYLSGALNRCLGKNFTTYVNEYRVKEAIRLMSDPGKANYTIEVIGFESGFNDRSNFYRSFKKLTGLSPTDFRKNLNPK